MQEELIKQTVEKAECLAAMEDLIKRTVEKAERLAGYAITGVMRDGDLTATATGEVKSKDGHLIMVTVQVLACEGSEGK